MAVRILNHEVALGASEVPRALMTQFALNSDGIGDPGGLRRREHRAGKRLGYH